jgi:hypothetical protein
MRGGAGNCRELDCVIPRLREHYVLAPLGMTPLTALLTAVRSALAARRCPLAAGLT